MAYRDLLLAALTYPDATPERALRSGVALARRLGGDLTLLAVKVDIPELRNPLANALIQLDEAARNEEARSAATAGLEEACVRIAAEEAGATVAVESLTAKLYEEAEGVCRAARTRDICLTPIGPQVAGDRSLAETVLFGSGRPVLVYPEAVEIVPAEAFGTVAIAWDGSARAARAVADALPILGRARDVRVFTAVGEKPQARAGVGRDLVRHLAAHGIVAAVNEQPAKGQAIGRSLADYVAAVRPELLVMGGFGHARLREFVLGGATRSVLEAPPCPVIMSH